MRTIGMLGGMSFEDTSTYYRHINEAVRSRLGGSHSARILLNSVDFQEVVDLQHAERWPEAGEYLGRHARTLEDAGADCVLMCCNTMYIVGDAIEAQLTIPFINIIDETARSLLADGRTRPFLIATRYTMEHGFYQERMARHGIEMTIPDEADRTSVHYIIFEELCQGRILERSRASLTALIDQAKSRGADSVIFGCTEIGLILDPAALSLPAYDSTTIHADAAIAFALELQD